MQHSGYSYNKKNPIKYQGYYSLTAWDLIIVWNTMYIAYKYVTWGPDRQSINSGKKNKFAK